MLRTSHGSRRRFADTLLVLAAVLVCVGPMISPAHAISSYNSRPAPERTNVGEMLGLYDSDHDGMLDRLVAACSGTMISSSVFLTAAHCLFLWRAGTRFFVSLDEDVRSELDQAAALGLTGPAEADWLVAHRHAVEGDRHWDPLASHVRSDTHDVGVIDFSGRALTPADVWTFTPAHLPTAGELDALGPRALDAATWTTVGYGSQQGTTGAGGHTYPGGDARLEAPMGFNALDPAWVRLGANESRGFGSACYGDSGGPNFMTIGNRTVLASTTITGDVQCYATNVTYRMDTDSARTFLAQFVTLP